ncbi:hypothetical protein CCP1ISM_50030 [Azospirillaceae bacterium]
MKIWSRKHNKCRSCKTIDIKHKGLGLCRLCWEKLIRNKTPKRKQWQKEYRGKNMERIRKNNDKYNHNVRQRVVEILGGKCKRCGFQDIRALQIDHINGGGYKEIRKNSAKVRYRLVLESVQRKENKYQLLCANCNWIKRYENKESRELGGAPRKS